MTARLKLSVADRIKAYVSPEPFSGCWLWLAHVDRDTGYARLNVEGRARTVHVLSYQIFVGPVPDGLELDHLCRVRCCVNPNHLEPVTRRVNVRRGLAGDKNRRKTHCPSGHEYNASNTYTYGKKRHCKTCAIEKCAERRRTK